jgi:hypothetical protein
MHVPFEFVLDQLYSLEPVVRPMFGCYAVYARNKIVLVLRDKSNHPGDNGVWLATDYEHHESLRDQFPSMQSIKLFGGAGSRWQNLPSNATDFEESVLHACRLILRGDQRIGRVPSGKKRKKRTKNVN